MKFKNVLKISGTILVLFMVIIFRLHNSDSLLPQKAHPIQHESSEGTKEDPFARARYNWDRLRIPQENEIPVNISTKENLFIKKLAAQTRKTHGAITDDWVSRGPFNIGGRTKALALDVQDEHIILAGGVSSGMWKSINDGYSWTKTTAPDQLHSVSCIAQNKASGKQHIWYYGTGEWAGSGRGGSAAVPYGGTNVYYRGDGIFKSTDNGESWLLLGSTVSESADETDSFDFVWGLQTFGENGLFAATSSGLFRSTDGGVLWNHVLDFGEEYPSTEITMTDEGIYYATIGGFGPDNGIYRSTDGLIWDNISPPDWPDSTTRTVIGPAPSNQKVLYFYTCKRYMITQLRKYEDGVGWTNLTATLPNGGELINYSGNMLILYVKPDDENTLFLGTVGMYRSTDGGKSFEVIGSYGDFHVDQHAIVFYPSDPKRMIVGNDGGLFRTDNNIAETYFDPYTGDTIDWESLNHGYLTTQFYSVGIDHETPGSQTLIGGMQDNGCMFTTSSDPSDPWIELHEGDGGYAYITGGGEYFYTNQGAVFNIWRHAFPNGTHEWVMVTPTATLGTGLWLSPFIMDAHDQKIMYLPWRKALWRNSDVTEIPFCFPAAPTDLNWEQLENITDTYISALGMSAAQPRRLYYGGMYGKLFRLDNPHTGQQVPEMISDGSDWMYGYIHCIAVDPRDADKVIVVLPNYGITSIFSSEDGGDTWKAVSGNLEENYDGTGCGPSVRWVSILYVEDRPVYFAGTSVGLFSTMELDSMNTTWILEGGSTIGNVVVDMIDVRQSDGFVAVGTHGNGVYTTFVTELPTGLDNITERPENFNLYPAFPNPFNSSTTIRFKLPKPSRVRITVYNLLGKRVKVLLDDNCQEGENRVQWTAEGLSSGTYFIRLNFEDFIETQKVLLIK